MNGTMHILLVEDSDTMREILVEYLKAFSGSLVIICDCVATLQQAIDRLLLPGIDVVVLDINLPNSAGVNSVEALFRTAPATPIVVLTGDECDELEDKCMRAGAQDHVRKSQIPKMLVKEFVQRLWHAILRYEQKKDVLQKYAPVCKQIEQEKKVIEKVIEKVTENTKDAPE